MQAIELKEHEGRAFDQDVLDEGKGHQLWLRFGNKIEVDPPTFQTGYQWHLKPKGWVGHIPIDNSLSLIIQPKVELGNLFGMLEYAYRIPFTQDDQLILSSDLPDFYQRLANILAKQVLRRTFCGLYKEYISRRSRLPFIRGRIDTTKMLNEPWQVDLTCHYQENTSNNEENQILVWTLFCIAQTGLCQGKIKNNVRQAYRGVHNFATLLPKSSFDCVGRHYTRLNCDYNQMHALCRFFLETTGPLHEVGKQSMLPFMVDMPKLYESFVTEWLKVFLDQNYPGRYRVKKQALQKIGRDQQVTFKIDIVLEDTQTGHPVCLMDTKYKVDETPSADDLHQVIAYAKVLGCRRAFLIYPYPPQRLFSTIVGEDTHVQAVTFSLDGDLEENGRSFFKQVRQYL